MNASTRKCTEVKPCNLMNCYLCRRRLIDQTATLMLESGAEQGSVDTYRSNAINALALEIQPKAKPANASARARKAPLLKHTEAWYKQTAVALGNLDSRDAGYKLLDAQLTIADLQHIWTLTGRTGRIPSKLNKAGIVTFLVENMIGYRLDTNAILNGCKS